MNRMLSLEENAWLYNEMMRIQCINKYAKYKIKLKGCTDELLACIELDAQNKMQETICI